MLKACLVGTAVTLALIAIPVVHLITFFPSPFIGGYLAGVRTSASDGQALLIGPVMGAILVVPIALSLGLSSLLAGALGFDLGLGVKFIGVVALVCAVYVAALGTLGAAVGGSSARKQAAAT